jgi:hypothetical protein
MVSQNRVVRGQFGAKGAFPQLVYLTNLQIIFQYSKKKFHNGMPGMKFEIIFHCSQSQVNVTGLYWSVCRHLHIHTLAKCLPCQCFPTTCVLGYSTSSALFMPCGKFSQLTTVCQM